MRHGRRFSNDAEGRARSLLLSILNSEERQQWERTGEVVVRGSKGGTYKLNGAQVWQLKNGRWMHICVDIRSAGRAFPWPDRMAAIILAIKSNEKKFLLQMYPGTEPWGHVVTVAACVIFAILLVAIGGVAFVRVF